MILVKAIWYLFRPSILMLQLKYAMIKLLLANRSLKLGDNVRVKNCNFGEHNYLASGVSLDNVSFGDYSYCNTNTKINNAEIGSFSCIGPSVKIGLASHPTDRIVSLHPAFYSTAAQVGKTFAKEMLFDESIRHTKVGSDVWIGANVLIAGGVSIGHGAVIASGAIVTKDIAPYTIVAGVPAKSIGHRFTLAQRNELLDSEWWNWTLDNIENQSSRFLNVDLFLEWRKRRENFVE